VMGWFRHYFIISMDLIGSVTTNLPMHHNSDE
jgi:hypothetical protein